MTAPLSPQDFLTRWQHARSSPCRPLPRQRPLEKRLPQIIDTLEALGRVRRDDSGAIHGRRG